MAKSLSTFLISQSLLVAIIFSTVVSGGLVMRHRRQLVDCAENVFAAAESDECIKELAADNGSPDESSDSVRCCKFQQFWQCVHHAAKPCGDDASRVTDSILIEIHPNVTITCEAYKFYPGECFITGSSWYLITMAIVFSVFVLVCCIGSCYYCRRKTHHYEPATGLTTIER